MNAGLTPVEFLRDSYGILRPFLGERARRLWAGTEARALGRGGVTLVSKATGLSRNTIHQALREIALIRGEGTEDPGKIPSPIEERSPSKGGAAEREA